MVMLFQSALLLTAFALANRALVMAVHWEGLHKGQEAKKEAQTLPCL